MSEIEIDGAERILIEPGEYSARFSHHETNKAAFGGKPKVYLIFTLVEPQYYGLEIYGAYNVKEIEGKGCRNGKFKMTRRQDLTREIMCLLPDLRLDRISLMPLRGKILRISVRTVDRDYKKRILPLSMQYSVVDQMLSLVEQGKPDDPIPMTCDP
jgi:hypothetical protein